MIDSKLIQKKLSTKRYKPKKTKAEGSILFLLLLGIDKNNSFKDSICKAMRRPTERKSDISGELSKHHQRSQRVSSLRLIRIKNFPEDNVDFDVETEN